ncbi:DNA polymerase III subunit delta' [Desulfotomaculum sp. 1211_IL3151]|uniref:DNA polymerase III subunit delta' n=1 Tax=Desulfotomaculum sp. 1211_IL3151 TaxID=3084055 RepID=UPI002FD94660
MSSLSSIIGHQQIVRMLKNSVQRERVAHAYLFMGPAGIGKYTVAQGFARLLLCEVPDKEEACGNCRACRQIDSGNHPDLHLLEPSGATLKIEQIRELQRQVQYKPFQAPRHVFIIEKAEAMTQEAANCFLKTLEEPGSQTVFILLSDQPYGLLPTILSRCQQLQFRPLSNQEVSKGLVTLGKIAVEQAQAVAPLAGGSLGRALKLTGGEEQWPRRAKALGWLRRLPQMGQYQALQAAEELATDRNEAVECLEIMLFWFRDLLVYHYTGQRKVLNNQDKMDDLLSQANCYMPGKLVQIIEEIKLAKEKILANANTRMTLEVMLLKIHSDGGNDYVS